MCKSLEEFLSKEESEDFIKEFADFLVDVYKEDELDEEYYFDWSEY